LKHYAAEGGRILVTRKTGAFTEHALPTEPLRDTEFGDGATHIEWIEDWLSRRSMQIHDLLDYRSRNY
jgi:hypothetical protein